MDSAYLHDFSAGMLVTDPGPSLGTDTNLIYQMIYKGYWKFLAEDSLDTTTFPAIPKVE